MTSFADITTMGVGGPIAHFIEPTTRVGLIEAVEEADLSMGGFAVFRTPGGRQRTVPTCLGRTERFEDWQVTFELKYKQIL